MKTFDFLQLVNPPHPYRQTMVYPLYIFFQVHEAHGSYFTTPAERRILLLADSCVNKITSLSSPILIKVSSSCDFEVNTTDLIILFLAFM